MIDLLKIRIRRRGLVGRILRVFLFRMPFIHFPQRRRPVLASTSLMEGRLSPLERTSSTIELAVYNNRAGRHLDAGPFSIT
jgi:hypothetical protein